MADPRKRSIAKTISWRVVATVATIVIVYAFTGEAALSFGVGVVEVAAKVVLYYGHERAWSRVEWGHDQRPTS